MSAIAITYYSLFGLTNRIAEDLSLLTGGDLVRIYPSPEYSFDANTAAKEIRNQIERGFCSELRGGLPDLTRFDTVFLGTPNWFRTMAPPMRTVIRRCDLSGKTLIPFCSHGGGGMCEVESDFHSEGPQLSFRTGLALGADYTLDRLRQWLESIGIDHE